MAFLTFLVVISFLTKRKVELEVKKKQIFCPHYGLGDLVSIVARLQARQLTTGLPMNDDTQMWHKIEPNPLSHFVTKVHLPLSQTYEPPLPKPEEKQLPIESSCHCLKPKCLPVPTVLLIQNIKKQCTQFGPTGNSYTRLPSTHSSMVGKLPNCSFRSLASSAQNRSNYIMNFVMS